MMNENSNHEWVLPASIPFSDLKGRDLEECVYWLLDAMGAKDLEWRTGGSGGGAADGGRDLEAHFFAPDEDGELRQQRWWIECKGRSGTVESSEVKAAVNNALAYEALENLVIATNTQFSNPTRDWVKEWQKKYPVPKIQLWDHAQLERYLSRHPDVVLRLFSEALSIQGRFQAMESRFWNRLEFTTHQVMSDLWKEKHNIDISASGVFAAIGNEFANGDITQRPWGAVLDPESALEVLATGLQNVGYLCVRSSRAGIDGHILVRTFAYLILVALDVFPAKNIAGIVLRILNRGEADDLPEEIQKILLLPILNQLLSEMQDICSHDCIRVSTLDRRALTDEKDEVRTYWLRLEPSGRAEEADTRFLRLEKIDAPCAVGFAVGKDHGCPLFAFEPSIGNVVDFMGMIKRVAAFRKEQAALRRDEDEKKRARLAAKGDDKT